MQDRCRFSEISMHRKQQGKCVTFPSYFSTKPHDAPIEAVHFASLLAIAVHRPSTRRGAEIVAFFLQIANLVMPTNDSVPNLFGGFS